MSYTYSSAPQYDQQYQQYHQQQQQQQHQYEALEDIQQVPQSYHQHQHQDHHYQGQGEPPQGSYTSPVYSAQDGPVMNQQVQSQSGFGFGLGAYGFQRQQQAEYQPVQQVHQYQNDAIPAYYADQPGEYDSQYRPDVQAYHDRNSNGTAYTGATAYSAETGPLEYKNEPQVPPSLPYVADGRVPNYKPAPLRWWFISLIILALGGLLASLAYATYVLPESLGNRLTVPGESETANSKRAFFALEDRQVARDATNTELSAPSSISNGPNTTPISGAAGGFPDEVVTLTPVATSIESTGPPEAPPSEDFAKETVVSSVELSSSSIITVYPTKTRASSDYADESVDATRASSDYGNEEVGTSTRPPDDYADESITPVYAPPPTDYGDETVTITHSEIPTDFLGTTTLADGHVVTRTPEWVTAAVATITSNGRVVTSTSTPSAFSSPTTILSTDATGHVVTLTTSTLVSASMSTAYDSLGNPTATLFRVIPTTVPTSQTIVSVLPKGHNFIGTFLPTLLTALLTIVVRMVDLQAKLYTPWHRLTSTTGCTAKESLCLRTSGWHSIVASFKAVVGGEFLVFLTTVLVACSALLVPLAAESVAMKLNGSCSKFSFQGCTLSLAVFPVPAKAAIGMMGFMLLVATCIMIVLTRWRTGVAANPWSIAGAAALVTERDLREMAVRELPSGNRAISHGRLLRGFGERKFKLGWFWGKTGSREYGIIMDNQQEAFAPGTNTAAHGENGGIERNSTLSEKDLLGGGYHIWEVERNLPFTMLTPWGRAVFLLFLSGVLAVILYYNNTGGDTAFELFMDDQGFGVRFMWTALGVITTFFWSSYFHSVATLSPYTLMSRSPQFASSSILLHPPSNPFSGLFRAIHRGHIYLILVSFTAILSEFMPLLLNQIPYRPSQTFVVHTVTYYCSVGVLSFMLLVILLSFVPAVVRWPHMPLDPSTIAGALFMVADSWMMWGFENGGGLGWLKEKERDRRIRDRGERYEYGEIVGNAGTIGGMRVGVDCVDAGGDHRF